MENTEIQKKVYSVINEVLKVPESDIRPESRFSEDLGADSLDKVTLLMALENEFGREITDEEAAKLVTVDDCLKLIGQEVGTQ